MACQISLKNSQNSILPTTLFGIFACTFSETAFLEIAVSLSNAYCARLRAVLLQSVKSKLGRTGESEMAERELERGFAGGLQLSIKFLTQTTYATYRAVIQSFLTACVQFRRYVAKLSMNSTANESSGSWNSLNFFALKIGGIVTYSLIIIVSLVTNSLIVIIVCKTPNLKKPINYFIANMASADLLYPIFVIPWRLSNLHTNYSFLIGGQLGQALCKPIISYVDSESDSDSSGSIWSRGISTPFATHEIQAVFLLHSCHVDVCHSFYFERFVGSLNTWRELGV